MEEGGEAELKGRQQQETEGKLWFHSHTPDVDGTHIHIFASVRLKGLYVGDLGRYLKELWKATTL